MLSLVCLSGYAQITNNLNLVWADEFNGNTLDASKWKVPPAWNRQGGSYWSADNYKMTGNGQLRLSVTEKDGKVYCGALRTHNLFDKKYGFFEVRCKVPQMQGGWAAFWMMPYGNKPGNDGNDGTEIDIFESINGWKGQINHALHWDGYGPEHKHVSEKMQRPDLYDDNYHVFSVMWTPKEYIFYIDNKETWRTSTAGVSDVKQYLKLTLEVSGSTWPGDWKKQKVKTIHWLIDYVRVYDYQPVAEEDAKLEFTSLKNNQTFNVGDQVQMHTDVTGSLSQLDEIKFYTKRGSEPYVLKRTSNISSEKTYWFNYFPTLAGDYKLKAEGYKNGKLVTSVQANASVNIDLGPLNLNFVSLKGGDVFNVGETVSMDVNVLGSLANADELQFLVKKDDGEFVTKKTLNINNESSHNYSYSPLEAGTYAFRITALKNDKYVTHVIAGGVSINKTAEPLSLNLTTLNSDEKFLVGDLVNMNVELLGDLSDADKIQFLVKKNGGDFEVQKTTSLSGASTYNYNWTSTETGNYTLKIIALKNSKYVTQVIANNITIDEIQEPLSLSFSSLKSGDTFEAGDLINISVKLTGDFSEADEIQFLARKMDGVFSVQKTENLTGLTEYNYNWTATEAGEYAFRVTALKGGKYVTHVVVGGISVERTIEPLSLNSTSIISSENYKVGDALNLSAALTGNLSDADEIQFLAKKDDGEFVIQKTINLSGASTYNYNWTASEAGEYSFRITAQKDNQYVTHILIGEITVKEVLPALSMNFTSVKSGDTYEASTQIPVNIKLSGDLSDADELQFLVREGSDAWTVKQTVSVSEASDYTYNWTPSESGNYSLRVTAMKNGGYVTHTIIGGIEIESNLDLEYTILEDGTKFNVGDKVRMTVKLLGDYSKVDQLKFVAQKIGETGTVVRTSNVRESKSAYGYKWTAKAGSYILKVAAFSKGVIIANVKANITVENPIKLKFRFLKNGQSYAEGNRVRMHARAMGNLSTADQIKFVVQKNEGANEVVRSYSVNPSKKAYNFVWVPKSPGNYKLKAEAYKDGVFVTIAVANVRITKSLQSRSYESNEADEFNEEESPVISTYPNPSSGTVNINLGTLKDAKIRVSNSSGQIVYQKLGLSGIHQFELNNKPGLYFIEVTSETENRVFKMIKK
jgi:beta-glucanase (GH16 family)